MADFFVPPTAFHNWARDVFLNAVRTPLFSALLGRFFAPSLKSVVRARRAPARGQDRYAWRQAWACDGPSRPTRPGSRVVAAINPGGCAVLLASHGVLVFHRTPAQAVMVGSIVEEAAQDAINAIAIGGPREIEPDMRAAALQRAVAFGVTATDR